MASPAPALVGPSQTPARGLPAPLLDRAKSAYRIASVLDHLPHELEHPIEERSSRRVGRDLVRGNMELHRRADEALQQGVMKLAGDARAFLSRSSARRSVIRRVMAQPKKAAIENVATAVAGTMTRILCCTLVHVGLGADDFDDSPRRRCSSRARRSADSSGRSSLPRRRRTASQSPALAKETIASSWEGSATSIASSVGMNARSMRVRAGRRASALLVSLMPSTSERRSGSASALDPPRILRLRELVQPLVEHAQALLQPQDRDQLLTLSGQAVRLESGQAKLPDQEPGCRPG